MYRDGDCGKKSILPVERNVWDKVLWPLAIVFLPEPRPWKLISNDLGCYDWANIKYFHISDRKPRALFLLLIGAIFVITLSQNFVVH